MEISKETLTEIFKQTLEKAFGSNSNDKPLLNIVKQFNEDKMEAIEVLYCKPLEADAHGDGMTQEEIVKMVANLNDNIQKGKVKGNIAHLANTDKIEPVRAWVNEVDCMIGEELIPEGMPLIKMKFHDAELWDKRKTGVLKGISIGAKGHKEPVGDQ